MEEGSTSITLRVQRSFPSFDSVSIDVVTINDTAAADEDFVAM